MHLCWHVPVATSLERVEAVLREHGLAGRVRRLADSTRTAAQAAAALGCDVGAIASSLVFLAGDDPLLVLTSGAHRVDTARVGQLVGAPLRQATAAEVREHTGFAIGGVAPVGHVTPLPTLVDRALAAHDELWAAAGHPHAVFPVTYLQLLALTGGRPADVGD